MLDLPPGVVADLAPGGVLRAALNLNNPVLVQGTASAPTGVAGSACDLYLTRTLRHATVVRGNEGAEVFATGLEAGAGVRESVVTFVASHPGYRLIDERFMVIPQALGTAKTTSQAARQFPHGLIEELKASGFVAGALRRTGQTAPAAPPA